MFGYFNQEHVRDPLRVKEALTLGLVILGLGMACDGLMETYDMNIIGHGRNYVNIQESE